MQVRRDVCLVLAGLLLFGGAVFAQGPANLLRNPGFELANNGVVTDWSRPEYWSGELGLVDDPAMVHAGKRAVQLTAVLGQSATGQKHWGRMLGTIANVSPGLNYRYSVWAKGTGALKLGAINYTEAQAGKPNYTYVWQEKPVALGADWQEVSLVFAPTSVDVIRVAVVAEVEGEGAVALVDDAALAVEREFAGTITATPYAMVPLGKNVTVSVAARREDGQALAGPVTVLVRGAKGLEKKDLTLDKEGKASIEVACGAEPALVKVDFVQADLGSAATSYVDVASQETYDKFAAAAKATKLQTPCHILYLGDSLTDFSRGFNYTDQVSFWLKTAHGDVTYRNAGVGGDYITRVWQRLNGDKNVYRLEAYNGLMEPKPQRMFMMLGHNDSKLTSGSGFTQPVVSLEDYKTFHKQVIEKLRQDSGGAPMTLLTNTSSVYEITKANADKAVAAGRGASLFGKPEVMEQFNAALREAAKELGCDVIDVYEPTRTYPNKPSLFTQDGVHMTLEGNHVVALEMLRYLGR
ncbi:MAG: GDSL-type esterase/lipase family protein [Armatimonadia bacterium]